MPNKNLLIFDDFSSNYAIIEKKLHEVAKDNFIVLTTKEGARGVDYKGINVAHVIVAYEPDSYSECVQALGRGCRELSSFAEGTIICTNPLTLDADEYLTLLQSRDDELAEALQINCKIARMLHNQVVTKAISDEDA